VSSPPPTLPPPSAPLAAKKKKKKRSKAKTGANGPPASPGDEELDYSVREHSVRESYDDDRDLTDDDDIPDLVDIDRPLQPSNQPQLLSAPMTATSSTSSKTPTNTSAGSKSKKKKKKTSKLTASGVSGSNDVSEATQQAELDGGQPQQHQKIWNTTTAEEKERIKEFWMGLSEQERRNLVRIEKEHVSKRVKEGSKILNCSCHVCGRKQYITMTITHLEANTF
jgi:hypothetical protein